jgi:hypothetical protein
MQRIRLRAQLFRLASPRTGARHGFEPFECGGLVVVGRFTKRLNRRLHRERLQGFSSFPLTAAPAQSEQTATERREQSPSK